MLAKLPFDIPKFEGNPGENPSTHITTYHLWCSSNYLVDDYVKLHLFQRTILGDAARWYIELYTISYGDISSISQTFLTHFQLLTRYDINSDLLSNFKQDNATLIYDHIHEWRHHKRLVRTKLPNDILHNWFIQSLQPHISKDVSMF